MSYLARIAARATGSPAAAVGSTVPSAASASPLAQSDQRLNLQGFAESSAAADIAVSPGPEAKGAAGSLAASEVTRQHPAIHRAADMPFAAPVVRPTSVGVEDAPTPFAHSPVMRPPERFPARPTTSAVATSGDAAPATWLGASEERPKDRDGGMPLMPVSREIAVARDATETGAPAPAGKAFAVGPSLVKDDDERSRSIAVAEPRRLGVEKALAKVEAWMRKPAEAPAPAVVVAAPDSPSPRPGLGTTAESAPMQPAAPRLSIGRIDVRVVSPSAPRPPARQPRAAPPPARRSSFGASPPFGWRQR